MSHLWLHSPLLCPTCRPVLPLPRTLKQTGRVNCQGLSTLLPLSALLIQKRLLPPHASDCPQKRGESPLPLLFTLP